MCLSTSRYYSYLHVTCYSAAIWRRPPSLKAGPKHNIVHPDGHFRSRTKTRLNVASLTSQRLPVFLRPRPVHWPQTSFAGPISRCSFYQSRALSSLLTRATLGHHGATKVTLGPDLVSVLWWGEGELEAPPSGGYLASIAPGNKALFLGDSPLRNAICD